jgi:hypothetical protein
MKLTLQQILHAGYKEFADTTHLPEYIRKAANMLMKCRTEQMGGYIEECPSGDFHRTWYHSCRHRSCPKCSYMAIEKWLTAKKSKALPCPHYHTIFTMPDSLNDVWLLNQKVFHDTFIKNAKDALFKLLKDPK